MTSRRVVVTGLGLVTPLGVGVRQNWSKLIAGSSGLVSTDDVPNPAEYKDLPSRVVGKVPIGSESEGKWDAEAFASRWSNIRRLSPFIQYALKGAEEALQDAQWQCFTETDFEDTGVCIGSGIGGLQDMYDNAVGFHSKGHRKMQPLFIPRMLANMAAGNISIQYGFKGPNHSVSTACATGNHAIGDASRFIKDGYCDVMVAGGTDASITPFALSAFGRAKSLSTAFNDDPTKASRPFDGGRGGFVMGEGAGILVLEELQHALDRNAKIYCEIAGYGLTGDAHHITSPPEDGNGALRAMRFAITQAGLVPNDIGYINAHATSTLLGDRAENSAINALFQKSNPQLAVSSTKGAIGHLLGAAGAVESIFTVLALSENILPPTLNCESPGGAESDSKSEFIFNYVQNQSQILNKENKLKAAINNSFGFGGTNASLLFKIYE
ncbi:Mitochondrial beta-keto-acyl synthase [Komagataella phaffii CBS 7435]|uniref:3-oxoacyl-[acyl-carrier-protein] synthase n=2 Tax=Komagataella phaffii TaxID=460519 RepID=C4R841_KOMPG|nr:Mitochondrial beta-keto-acyl synthase with possible role in fatty acid synthesis [Komagataella phaffii GS115]AOA65342.1 GQ67_04877T0 [Komagataella phaffii]CAH2450843.1 Mitochondrial beta-keto-acyl synthase [Komagataella phaffii CBS 7435]AOA69741.1 GQ68_04849T0 [Komagataella phaffii GS115]CAY71766.1 Mitochondrial beta-keto-acyl synthase with possible role in fatty acid synthesis [Komagataella phaffii GS115]CCA40633.1 Mitochondrial beta-keto-acyl synthase [Komagataella phaffii CBS 7435]